MFKSLRDRKGQNTVEYILIITVVVAVILLVGKYMPGKFQELITKVFSKVTTAVDQTGGGQ
ncbi:MAG: hypothetical protein V1647_04225 [Pseudomonadota bacterium]